MADLVSGGTPSKARPDWWSGGIPWASPKDMKRLRLRDTLDHVSEEAAKAGSRVVPAKTIFVVIRGMILAKTLPVAMAEVPMAFNQDMKAIVPRPVVDPDYLLYALASRRDDLAHEIGTAAHGTRRLGSSALEALQIPLPPRSEQRAIAYLLARLQSAEEAAALRVTTYRALKAAVVAKLFREVLNCEPIRRTEIGEIPESWTVRPLHELLAEPLRNGYSGPPSGDRTGVRTLTPSAVTLNRFVPAYTKMAVADRATVRDLWLRDGDIFVERANTRDLVGRAALYRGPDDFAIFPDLLIRVRVSDEAILPEVMVEWLMSPWARRYFAMHCRGAATSMPKIDHRTLADIPVPVPSRDEQIRLRDTCLALDAALRLSEKRKESSERLKTSMLDALITAKVRLSPRLIGQLSLRAAAAAPKPQGKVDERVVQEAVRRIVDAVEPEKIILFGSAARGEMTRDSDLDFLVVKSGVSRRETQRRIRGELRGIGVPVDVIVVTPEDVERDRDTIGLIIRPALREGRVVYAAA